MIDLAYLADVPLYVILFGVPAVAALRGRRAPADGRQSWRMTLVEVASGKLLGSVIGYSLNLFVLPHIVQAEISPHDAAIISTLYVGVATIRSVITRRVFEALRVKGIN